MARKKKKEEALEMVFLDDVLGDLETKLGVELAAFDPDDLDNLVYGVELQERLHAAGERDPADLIPEEEVGLTEEDLALIHEAEAEYGIRLVVYHWGAHLILYGGDVIDDALAECEARAAAK
jgi:hypothetical protein